MPALLQRTTAQPLAAVVTNMAELPLMGVQLPQYLPQPVLLLVVELVGAIRAATQEL
jgi:hypothetical protein